MPDPGIRYAYVAVDAAGRRQRGALMASDEAAAFELLKREGLSPLRLSAGAAAAPPRGVRAPVTDRQAAGFLAELAALLGAGADIRSALSILGSRAEAGPRALAAALAADIGGGSAPEQAFAAHLPPGLSFVGALVAAGSLSGDLAGALRRASEMLEARTKLRDQMVSALSYPAFVFASTLAATAFIFTVVMPSLAPLVEEAGSDAPLALSLMIGASSFLRDNVAWLAGALTGGIASLILAARAGLLTNWIERLTLDGPFRRTASSLTYGGFAVALGGMLGAGAPVTQALSLATQSVQSALARRRLEPALLSVRQGETISDALGAVPGLPAVLARMVLIGEATGSIGPMLSRAGKLEEEVALRRIEAAGRIVGPALIVFLGAVIGLLMAALLSGVSQLGQSALDA